MVHLSCDRDLQETSQAKFALTRADESGVVFVTGASGRGKTPAAGPMARLALYVGLEQPIANGAKRTVLPGGGRKQGSLTRRVLPRGP